MKKFSARNPFPAACLLGLALLTAPAIGTREASAEPSAAILDDESAYESEPAPLPQRIAGMGQITGAGWEILAESYGDLNGDKAADLAFVIEGTDPKLVQANSDFGDDRPVDHNPRVLGIYFKNPVTGMFEKALQSNDFIPLKDSYEMDEPFGGAEIREDGILSIDIGFWTSMGSWSMSGTHYAFRYRKGRFELVYLDYNLAWRNSGATTEIKLDFDARTVTVEKGNFSSEEGPESVWTRHIEIDRPYALGELEQWYSGEEFVEEPVLGAEAPILPECGAGLDWLTPAGWSALAESYGDLNGDGAPDLAFVVQGTDPDLIEAEAEDGPSVDRNPRVLGIYFMNPASGMFEKKLQADAFIPAKEGAEMVEPLVGASIEEGRLGIELRSAANSGEGPVRDLSYDFRYRKGRFELTALDYYRIPGGGGDTIDARIDFDAKSMTVETGARASGEPGVITERRILLEKPYALGELPPWYSGAEFETEAGG